MQQRIKVWDNAGRVFHWSLVLGITLEAALLQTDGQWHIWVGYGVLALVAARIVWGFIGTRHARFSAFPPSVNGAVEHLREISAGEVRSSLSHNALGAFMVYNILATIIVIATTGYMMTTIAYFGISWVKDVHELMVNWLLFSVFLHIAGVIYESRRTKDNLVKSMITGYKTLRSD